MSQKEQRDAALAREAAVRAAAVIRPLQLLSVDPLHLQRSESLDPFWRNYRAEAPAATEQPQQEAADEPSAPPTPDPPRLLARRFHVTGHDGTRSGFEDTRELWIQSVMAWPRERFGPGHDVHADLREQDEDTRAWALLTLDAQGLDPARWRVDVWRMPTLELPEQERAMTPDALSATADPDPVFAALDRVCDAQWAAQRADVVRVTAAVGAWRAARRQEHAPTAHDTPYQKGFFLDLGMKLKVSDVTAKNLVHAAERLERSTPTVWQRFLDARVPWRAMQIVHAELDGLDESVLPAFDTGAAAKVVEVSLPCLKDALRRLRERLQPTTADERHDRAFRRRRVEVEAGADAMGWLHAYLPMAELGAVEHQLTKAAIAAHGLADEQRTVAQLKADVLLDGLVEALRRPADPADAEALVPARRGVVPRVAVLIPAMTALGHSTACPILDGYGPIGIRMALRLAGEAKSWARVLTDPVTGAILTLGRKKYRPTKDMRTLLRLLDGGGRGPGRPVRADDADVDHNRAFSHRDEQGETAIGNLMLLSRKDHTVKTADEAAVRLLADRSVTWRTRSGNVYVTRPPDPIEPTPVPPHLLTDEDPPPF